MNITCFNGRKGNGFGYMGQWGGVSLITIRPESRDNWIHIIDDGKKVKVIRRGNHETADSGDMSFLDDYKV